MSKSGAIFSILSCFFLNAIRNTRDEVSVNFDGVVR